MIFASLPLGGFFLTNNGTNKQIYGILDLEYFDRRLSNVEFPAFLKLNKLRSEGYLCQNLKMRCHLGFFGLAKC